MVTPAAPAPVWPAGRPRVLVTDCWLTNAGDAAIALATQRIIDRHAPGAAVLHAAYGADLVADRYPGVAFVPPLEALLGTRWTPPAPEMSEAGRALVGSADLVVSQGGGFLRAGYAPWSRLDALATAADLVPALILHGQTIGRFDLAFARRLLHRVLRAADIVVVRDPASVDHVVEVAGSADGVVLGADVAIALAREQVPADPEDLIGVVLTGSPAPDDPSPIDRRAVAAALLQSVVAAHPNRRVVVWSTAQGVGNGGDDVAAAAAVDRLGASERARVEVVEGHVDAEQAMALLARCAATASMRLHPALLGAGLGRDVVLVMGDQKRGALDGSTVRVLDDADPSAPRRAAELLAPAGSRDPDELLGPALLERLDRTVGALGDAVRRAAAAAEA